MSLTHSSLRYGRSNAKAYARTHLHGVWGAIPYLFTADDELDKQGLRYNIRYCIDNKLLDGIYCGHFMSEFWALTTEERKRAAEIVVDECRGSIPVMVHTGHTSVKESVELCSMPSVLEPITWRLAILISWPTMNSKSTTTSTTSLNGQKPDTHHQYRLHRHRADA